jgi:AraC-like DNA-binding protein
MKRKMRGQRNHLYDKVLNCVEERQLFLQPTLTLSELSIIIGTNTTYLSNTINDSFGGNFHALVNHYRVNHAKKLLREGQTPLSDIPQKSGFASKSAFYAAFQKEEGLTPLRYQRYTKSL